MTINCVGVLVFKHIFPYARDEDSSHFIDPGYGVHVQTTQIPDKLFHGLESEWDPIIHNSLKLGQASLNF